MLTEQEKSQVHRLCTELEQHADSDRPGRQLAWHKLQRLANTTGDEWEALIRQYLSERSAQPQGVVHE